jgi:hypothetical protein
MSVAETNAVEACCAIYPFERAKEAYVAVAGSSRDRVILRPYHPVIASEAKQSGIVPRT